MKMPGVNFFSKDSYFKLSSSFAFSAELHSTFVPVAEPVLDSVVLELHF